MKSITRIEGESLKDEFESFKEVFLAAFNMVYSYDVFEWKYLRPMTQGSHLLRIEENGKIAGYRGLWTLTPIAGSFQCIDTCIHPKHKGKGLFKYSNNYISENYTAIYNLPNENSRPGYYKSGWEKFSELNIILGYKRSDFELDEDFLTWRFVDKPNFRYLKKKNSIGSWDVFQRKKGFYVYMLSTKVNLNGLKEIKRAFPTANYKLGNEGIIIKKTGEILVNGDSFNQINPIFFDMI